MMFPGKSVRYRRRPLTAVVSILVVGMSSMAERDVSAGDYSASVSNNHDGTQQSRSGPNPVVAEGSYVSVWPQGDMTGMGRAAAGIGMVQGALLASRHEFVPPLGTYRMNYDASAASYVPDLSLTGEGPTVPTQMSFSLGGAAQAFASSCNFAPGAGAVARIIVRVRLYVGSAQFYEESGYIQEQAGTNGGCGIGVPGRFSSGMIPSPDSDRFSTSLFDAPVGTPIGVRLELQLHASVVVDNGASGPESRADAVATVSDNVNAGPFTTLVDECSEEDPCRNVGFSFALSGPVFELPPGYTANSVEANIIDNSYAGDPTLGVIVPSPIERLELSAPAPNPLRSNTAFRLRLVRTTPIALGIVGVDGRRVRQIVSGSLAAGDHRLAWDGRDDRGNRVPPGVYLVAARASGDRASRRIVVLN